MPLDVARRLFARRPAPADAALVRDEDGTPAAVRLSWVWTTKQHPDANLGDALSAVVVSVMSGLAIKPASFDQPVERMAAVGTIGHAQRNGRVHLWGTGFDLSRNSAGALAGYSVPDKTDLVVHAVRGRQTAKGLRALGVEVPDVFGDPVWFLPRIFPLEGLKKRKELGVIVHISELEEATAVAKVKAALVRYGIPAELADDIAIINTYTDATVEAFESKVREIAECKRILSTSLHGLVIAETYNIPCAWFSTNRGASDFLKLDGAQPIDHRMIDFYGGVGRDAVLTYFQPLHEATRWEEAMTFIDRNWEGLTYTGKDLFDAFPLRRAVRFKDKVWRRRPEILAANRY
ncbi:polysaccharide pyruvyl transferase family protein [Rhizobium sp. YIM 134829]|uniref:polysaccharide pyruvyl transferase family protein n=1 Tax=Rhizobium sp. YIM 134829 TaxID=3390453 RepID=UPI003978B139